LFFVGSGPLPPNPSELLNHQRMKALFETIRQQFEYIVIDTPPIGLVADAFSFAPHVDCTAFIVRQGHTRREDLDIVDNVYRKRQLPNPCVILNAVRLTRSYSYGGRLARYGYGYYEEEKPKRKKWRVL
jgi:Mrp family chromosome partitioning ATPase